MTSVEGVPENPHVLSFSNEPLGIHAEVTIDHLEMERLTPDERASLERLLAAASYTFALLVHTKPEMRLVDWKNQGIKLLDDIHEAIFNLEGGLPQGFMRRLLGLDIEVPSYEEDLGKISRIT